MGGAKFGYLQLWVVLATNQIAMLVQTLVNPRWLTALAGVLAGLIIGLNVFLVFDVLA